MSWIDIHTHLNLLKINVDEVLAQAKQVGVERLITIGTEPADHPIVMAFAEKYFPVVSCTLGTHPNDFQTYSQDSIALIEPYLQKPYVVAIGEIGLDYYHDGFDKELQKKCFRKHLELALKHNMPVEIHTRDAEEDTTQVLKEMRAPLKGVVHCFTGTQKLADEALQLGLDISISGVVTFKNATALQDVVRSLPLDRIHVETDAPFLSPTPLRGKPNQPAYVVHTAEYVAQLKNVSIEQLQTQLKKNALRTFPKLVWN